MIMWLAGLAALLVVLMALLVALAAFTGFADIPCQDGVWNEAKHTCVPTGNS
jgi:hypothetical protein